ncbi:MAG: M56 family metallopeptidase [Bacteroidota bacterium]
MAAYLIEAGLVHLLLYLGYHVFLRKQTDYPYMRLYLVGSTIAALLTPLLEFSILPIPQTISQAQEILLQPVIITEGETGRMSLVETTLQLNWRLAPVSITAVLALTLLIGLLQILWAFVRSRKTRAFGIPVRILRQEDRSFTFLRCIFTPSNPDESVLRHEKGHADLLHSLDILLLHSFRIFFWWTPSTWWTLRELRLIHEYQADEKALKATTLEDYKKTLISRTLSSMNLNLASSFHDGALFKRLKAMQAKRESIHKWRTGILGILVASTVIVFSCTDGEIQEIAEEASMSLLYPDAVEQKLDEIKKEFPDGDFKVLEIKQEINGNVDSDGRGQESWQLQKLKEIKEQNLVRHVHTDPDGDLLYVIVEHSAQLKRVSEASKSEDGVYTIAEEQPEFEGGIQQFYGHIASNMSYPKQARQMGIQGKVYVQFVVNKDGTVSDVEVKKGIGAGCDKEAARVVAESTGWIPGKVDGEPVSVRMIVPILFKLEDSSADPEQGSPPTLD